MYRLLRISRVLKQRHRRLHNLIVATALPRCVNQDLRSECKWSRLWMKSKSGRVLSGGMRQTRCYRPLSISKWSEPLRLWVECPLHTQSLGVVQYSLFNVSWSKDSVTPFHPTVCHRTKQTFHFIALFTFVSDFEQFLKYFIKFPILTCCALFILHSIYITKKQTNNQRKC